MRSILLVHCYDLIYILNTDEILNNEDADNESEKSENEEDTERNPMPIVVIKELEDFAKDKRFSVRILPHNYDKKTNEKKNATVACIHFGKPVLKKYVPKSDQLAHRNNKSQRCDCKFEAYIGRAKNGTCSIKMKNTKHNHSFSEDQSAQLSNKKCTSDQIKLIAELHKAESTPTSIREAALVQQNPGQRITQKSVYNAISRRLMECLKTGQSPYMLQEPSIVSSKGRPKGSGNRKQDRALSSTQRNSSQFEYVEMKMKKEEAATSRRKAKIRK